MSGFHAGLAAAQIGCLGGEAGLGRAVMGKVWCGGGLGKTWFTEEEGMGGAGE